MIEHQKIPITKIISAACRNFMAFSGLHNFEFKDGMNSIIGGNASGKSSLLTLIKQALSPETTLGYNGQRHANNTSEQSLLELKFIAANKLHFLRRVISGDNTTDLHLYIGDNEDTEFLRDGGVLTYLTKLKPVLILENLRNSRDSFYASRSNNRALDNLISSFPNEVTENLNKILPLSNTKVSKIVKSGNDVVVEYKNGDTVCPSMLSSSDSRTVFVLVNILSLLENIEENNLSTVILIDEIGAGLDRSSLRGLNEAIKVIFSQHDCQFMITSRFANGRLNPIRINRSNIPRYYHIEMSGNKNSIHQSYYQNPPYTKQVNWNWKQ